MDLVIELKIKNLNDWTIIQPLLKRLRISFVQKSIESQPSPKEPLKESNSVLNELNALLDSGVDASYYGDAVAYQRDVRNDVIIPFRN